VSTEQVSNAKGLLYNLVCRQHLVVDCHLLVDRAARACTADSLDKSSATAWGSLRGLCVAAAVVSAVQRVSRLFYNLLEEGCQPADRHHGVVLQANRASTLSSSGWLGKCLYTRPNRVGCTKGVSSLGLTG